MSGKIQNSDIKSVAELTSPSSLPNDDKIYVTALGLNKTLKAAIIAGDLSGASNKSFLKAHSIPATVVSAFDTVIFTIEDFDTSNAYNNTNGQYTAPYTGYYLVNASLYGCSPYVSFFVSVNGIVSDFVTVPGTPTTGAGETGSEIVYATAGQIIKLVADGACTFTGYHSGLCITYMGT